MKNFSGEACKHKLHFKVIIRTIILLKREINLWEIELGKDYV